MRRPSSIQPAYTALRLFAIMSMLLGLLAVFPTAVSAAGSSVVRNCGDGVDPVPADSLRAAVQAANADTVATSADPHVIRFELNPACDTIPLAGTHLPLSNHVDIQGPGAGVLAVSGQSQSHVFQVGSGVTATISGLTIADGNGDLGGGIANDGTLTVRYVVIRDNSARIAGGIYNDWGAQLTVISSTLTLNRAPGGPGGAIWTGGPTTITNSTLSQNSAAVGGALQSQEYTTTLIHSTVALNLGGTLRASDNGTISLSRTIVASGSSVRQACDTSEEGQFISLDFNLDTDGSCGLDQDNDIPDGNPALQSLADNGGPTPTQALRANSDALNHIPTGDCAGVAADQRGVARPQGGDCDIGAYEAEPTAPHNASIVINSNAAWTNNPDLSVRLQAVDYFGITRYRLAETQAGLGSASDVPVTPAQGVFDLTTAFTLSSGDDASRTVWLRVCDADDQCQDASDTIGLDTTAPVITGAATTPSLDPYAGEWINEPVTVTFTCVDTGIVQSGIATDTVMNPVVVSTEGASQTVTSTGTCIDTAGNSALAASVSNINIDTTDPVVTAPEDMTVVAPSSDPVVVTYPNAAATDALSGVADGWPQCVPPSASLFSVGQTPVTCTAQDIAGNEGSDIFTITVVRDWVQGCLFAGSLSQVSVLGYGEAPTVWCARGEVVVLQQGNDYFGCSFAGSLSQVGTSEPVSCGRGALVELAAGDDLHGCMFAGRLSQLGYSEPTNCERGEHIGLATIIN